MSHNKGIQDRLTTKHGQGRRKEAYLSKPIKVFFPTLFWQNLQRAYIMLSNFGKPMGLLGLPIPAPLMLAWQGSSNYARYTAQLTQKRPKTTFSTSFLSNC